MPAISKPTRFTGRITPEQIDDTVMNTFLNSLPRDGLRYCVGQDEADDSKNAHEGANRPHYHFCMEVRLSDKTLAKRIKEEFNVGGNGGFKCTIEDWDYQYCGYVTKTRKVALHHVLEGDIIPWIPKAEFIKEIKKKKKDAQPSRIEFLRYCQEKHIPPDWQDLLRAYIDFKEGYYKDWDAVSAVRYVLYNLGKHKELKEDIIGRLRKNFECLY